MIGKVRRPVVTTAVQNVRMVAEVEPVIQSRNVLAQPTVMMTMMAKALRPSAGGAHRRQRSSRELRPATQTRKSSRGGRVRTRGASRIQKNPNEAPRESLRERMEKK